MVNVTKDNFLEASNELLALLPTAAFVAIDEEMSGISVPGSPRPEKVDTPEDRFLEIRKVPERYSIIQVGVALFHENPEWLGEGTKHEFIVRKYNFFLFPPANNYHTREVTLNPSAVAFLNEHAMNFDVWTKKGVSFVTGTTAEIMLEKYKKHHQQLKEQQKKDPPDANRNTVELVRTEDIHFHARAMASLREWIDVARPDDGLEGSSFLLPSCNGFLRRALYESIGAEYPSLLLEKHMNQIRVLRMNQAEHDARQERLLQESWNSHIMEVGFWRVFYAISMANKGFTVKNHVGLAKSNNEVPLDGDLIMEPLGHQIPVVVHNGLMDMLFLLTHLHAHKLPDSFVETKHLITSYFPLLYDTKILATECYRREQNTALENLFVKLIKDDPLANGKFLVISEGEDQAHEASYDAYMTGAIFCRLVQLIGAELPDFASLMGADALPLSKLDVTTLRTKFGRNKLFLMQTMYTIDLENSVDPLSRGMLAATTYRVAGSDPSVTTRDIVRCLTNLTNGDNIRVHFEIVWVNDTTFLVAARDVENPEMLEVQGVLILKALTERFVNASICSLADHLKKDQSIVEHPRTWISVILEILGMKRIRNGSDGTEGEQLAKRQRVN